MKKFLNFFLAFLSFPAFSEEKSTLPVDWQMNFQEAASPTMQEIANLHHFLFWIILAIVLFVCALVFYACVKFHRSNNQTPSKTTHNVKLEIIWTLIPIIILIIIGIPSVKSLYESETIENAEMTVKIVGHQWYWSYIYPDHDNISFDSYMIKDEELKPGQPRLLTVDNQVVLPVDTKIKFLITASDVIHAWAVPAFGIKKDAVPGRTNETWVTITKPGTYYGQCSELCGVGHGFMPIAVKAVPKEEFIEWTKLAKQQFGAIRNPKTLASK